MEKKLKIFTPWNCLILETTYKRVMKQRISAPGLGTNSTHIGINELFRLEKLIKVIKSNHQAQHCQEHH